MRRRRGDLVHAGKHPLSARQRAAVTAIAKSDGLSVTDEQLRAAIGAYATNVIVSLERERQLIRKLVDERWALTPRGLRVAYELADELTSASTSSIA